jgi:hypothetical protein
MIIYTSGVKGSVLKQVKVIYFVACFRLHRLRDVVQIDDYGYFNLKSYVTGYLRVLERIFNLKVVRFRL